jgi:hypothetical protein
MCKVTVQVALRESKRYHCNCVILWSKFDDHYKLGQLLYAYIFVEEPDPATGGCWHFPKLRSILF